MGAASKSSAADPAGLKIVIAGNCQVTGLSECLRLRRPDWRVEPLFMGVMRTESQLAHAAQLVEDCDIIVAQPKVARTHAKLLDRSDRPLTLIPQITFSGFHPDVIRPKAAKGRCPSPLGAMNSRIALAGFLLGLDEARTARLYNAYVYRRLGYFDEFSRAVAFQQQLHVSAGWTLGDAVDRWRTDAAFMHQPLHPTIAVLDDLAGDLCGRMGEAAGPAGRLPDDSLDEESIWPVYPELAQALGVEGSMAFRPAGKPAIGLEAFVSGCFAAYRRTSPDPLVTPDVLAAAALLRETVR